MDCIASKGSGVTVYRAWKHMPAPFKCADYSSYLLSFLLSPFFFHLCDTQTHTYIFIYTPVLYAIKKRAASVVVIIRAVVF